MNDSLAAYVKEEVLEGDNKYFCGTCKAHVDAVKQTKFKSLPNVLIFHLKRFDFNMQTMQRSKIHDFFEFPLSLDMSPYLSEPAASQYELSGILVHMGTSDSGHYYSYIRDRHTHQWFQFNDSHIEHFDPSHIQRATFGGTEDGSDYQKNYSAYMLL